MNTQESTQNKWTVVTLKENTEGYIEPRCRKPKPFVEVIHEVGSLAEAFELQNTLDAPTGAQVRINGGMFFAAPGLPGYDEYVAWTKDHAA